MKFTLLSTLVASSILLTGCAGAMLAGGAAAGAGTYAYVNGELKSTEKYPIDSVYDAAVDTVDDMDLNVVESSEDALTARIHAKGTNDKDVYFNMESIAENKTELRIRVNVFGDERMTERIYDEFEENLQSYFS